jgi:hypothetical protein
MSGAYQKADGHQLWRTIRSKRIAVINWISASEAILIDAASES